MPEMPADALDAARPLISSLDFLCEIGIGAVVAQGSIVGGNVEPHCIYGGVPAKKLREDVVWSRSASYDDIPLIFR